MDCNYRSQRSCGKVMTGVCMAGACARGHAWLGVCMACMQGHVWQGDVHDKITEHVFTIQIDQDETSTPSQSPPPSNKMYDFEMKLNSHLII